MSASTPTSTTSSPQPKSPAAAVSITASSPFGLPAGFVPPFKRVPMQERMDDALACIAILTGHSLQKVTQTAVELGYPSRGPAFPTEELMAKLLMKLGSLLCTVYKEFTSFDALPEVALLYIDWSDEMEIGRHIVWHHVRGTAEQEAFSYVIDPAPWVMPDQHIHTDFRKTKVTWYMEVRRVPSKT